MMYQTGDQVVYGIHGVCRVMEEEIRTVDKKQVVYLALEPVGQDGSRYLVPTHNAAAMGKLRPMLTREALDCLLQSPAVHADGWIRDENQRKQAYRELIGSGDADRLARMLATLYRHKKEQRDAGRKVHLCDDNFLRDAEKLLTGEIAVILGMNQEEARRYLRSFLKAE